ncbi:MAG TPA: PKD domain-containing protein [Chryseosolibacter sp.]|nr:PKD domain-containing protein [Chryseosolibacter sp.]
MTPKVLLPFFSALLLCVQSFSQCFSVDFAGPSNACRNQPVTLLADAGHAGYQWDFCPGELDSIPAAAIFQNGAGSPFKVDIVESDGLYYGFYTSRSTGNLYRLDFGTDVKNTPVPVPLGNAGVGSASWLTVDIVKEGDQFYGIGIDFYNRVFRFSFGTSLTNQPVGDGVLYTDGLLANPIDLVVLEDSTGKYAFVANLNSNKLVRLRFPTSFADAGSSVVTDFIETGSGNHGGLAFIRECGSWYAMVSTAVGTLNRIHFDDGLSDSNPVVSAVPGISFGTVLRGTALAYENGTYYAFAQSQNSLYRVNFGTSITNAPQSSTNFGNLGVMSDVFGFSMHKVKSDWLALSSENSNSNIYRFDFPSACVGSVEYATGAEVSLTTGDSSGAFAVSMTATDENGHVASVTKTLNVSTSLSPAVSITFSGICANSPVDFFSNNSSGDITSFDWDFGDGSTHSSVADPVHIYPVAGTYVVTLDVQTPGCNRTLTDTITVYDEPVPDFTVPPLPICTNSTATFVNNTPDVYSGNMSYRWFVDDSLHSESRDLELQFSSTADKTLKLETAIPGCASEVSKVVSNIGAGPVVDFTVDGMCEMDLISLTNTSEDAAESFQWFVDGDSLTSDVNAEVHLVAGNYSIRLQAASAGGCVGDKTRSVDIYPQPVAGFDISPALICVNDTVHFIDTTEIPPGFTLGSVSWDFGDGGSGAGAEVDHVYGNHGEFIASLISATNVGCADTITKSVTVRREPVSDFTTPATACLNQNITLAASAEGLRYEWDLCPGELSEMPEASVLLDNSGSGFNVDVVTDSGFYYGFYASRSNRKLYRLDFGTDMSNNPERVDLGNLGVASPTWLTVKIVKSDGVYYGFAIDFYNTIYRFTLGGSPGNTPSAAEVIYENGLLANPIDMALIADESGKYVFVANLSDNSLVRIPLGSSFGNPVSPAAVQIVEVSGSGNLSGITFNTDCGVWHALTSSISGGQISKLTFYNGLGTAPEVETLSLPIAVSSPGGISLAYDNARFLAFVVSQQTVSKIYRIDFGGSLSNSVVSAEDLGDLGMLRDVFGFSMYKAGSSWHVFATQNVGDNIWKIAFPELCFSEATSSSDAVIGLRAEQAGHHDIILTTYDEQGYRSTTRKSIEISLASAASFAFTTENQCAGAVSDFTVETASGDITGYAWTFGNGTTSTRYRRRLSTERQVNMSCRSS